MKKIGRPKKYNDIIVNSEFAIIKCKHGDVIVDINVVDKIKLYTWFTKKSSNNTYYVYASITFNKKQSKISLHRFLIDAKVGEIVDHKNRNTLDNRIINLRKCSKSDNNRNAKKNIRGNCRYKGVTKRPSGKYGCYISFNNKTICLGTFNTEEEAALIYNKKAKEFFGEFANLNNIGETNGK